MLIIRRIFLISFSIIYWTFFILSCIFMFAIACMIWLVTIPFGDRLCLLHLFSSFWGHSYIWLNPLWPTKMTGRKKIKCGKTYVIISNHQSMLDILLLYGLFRHYKWVSKKENFSIPIIGWLMRLNRYIEIDRGSSRSYPKLMKKTSYFLNKDNSVLMFPEGTRHPGGYIGPFRDGSFRMALENKVGLIPVLLDGTAQAIPKGNIILTGRQKIKVKILDEIPYNSFSEKSPKELMNEVREMMIKEYETMKSGIV